ncbi:MAG: biotin/lipoyl-containing protein [Planctomycetota bacterium]
MISRRYQHGEQDVQVSAAPIGDGRYRVRIDDREHVVEARTTADGGIEFRLDGVLHRASAVTLNGGAQHVRVDGRTHELRPRDRSRKSGGAADGTILAPMTGTILKVAVELGAVVEPGQLIAVLGAMKMEHKLVAPIAGVLCELSAESGTTVEQGSILARIEPGSAKG